MGDRSIAAAFCAVALGVASSGALAEMYKCKDASGRISYSEQPCRDGATEKRIKTDVDGRDDFIRQLHELAALDAVWTAALIQSTLGVQLTESFTRFGVTHYGFAGSPAGATRESRAVVVSEPSRQSSSVIELRFDVKRCVSADTFRQVFGTARNGDALSSEYVVRGGAHKTDVLAVMNSPDHRCVSGVDLRQNIASQQSGNSPRRPR